MNLYLITIHISMLVLGVDSIKNSSYSNLEFIVDQNKLFKDELQIICNCFNAICNANIGNILQEDILRYCVEATNIKILSASFLTMKQLLPLSKEFNGRLHEMSKIQEIKPNYMFLNQILEAKNTNISGIFAAVKRRLSKYTFESISECQENIQAYNNSHIDIFYDATAVCNKYVSNILDLDRLITIFMLTNNERTTSGKDLVERILCFLKEFYENNDFAEIIPAIDANTYNNYMLVLAIIQLDDVLINCRYFGVSNGDHEYVDRNVVVVQNLFNRLSVETFMFLVQDNKDLIIQMENNITVSNIKFWNEFNISKILGLQKILDINYNTLIQELKRYIFNNLECLNQKGLDTYITMLEGFKAVILTIIEKKVQYGNIINESADLCKEINTTITMALDLIEKLNHIVREDTNTTSDDKENNNI